MMRGPKRHAPTPSSLDAEPETDQGPKDQGNTQHSSGDSSPRSWRKLLSHLLTDPIEFERLCVQMGVSHNTLFRWARGETQRPAPYLLRSLLSAIPDATLRAEMASSMASEFDDFVSTHREGDEKAMPFALSIEPPAIPALFYKHVLNSLASAPETLCFWSTCQLLLQQLAKQLDSSRRGCQCLLLRLSPPAASASGKIRTLYEYMRLGTPPFDSHPEETHVFHGAESLAGEAVLAGRTLSLKAALPSSDAISPVQAKTEHQVALPIGRTGHIAGALLCVSHQPMEHLALLEDYATLASTLFSKEEFLNPSSFELVVMPPPHEQVTLLSSLRSRMSTLLTSSSKTTRLSYEEAMMRAQAQLEEELILMGNRPPD